MNQYIDDMLSQLCNPVNNKNKELEKRAEETDYKQFESDTAIAPYSRHLDPTKQEQALVNKAYTALKERAEVSNLTDSFRKEEATQVKQGTEGSLAKVSASFFRYSSILQAVV